MSLTGEGTLDPARATTPVEEGEPTNISAEIRALSYAMDTMSYKQRQESLIELVAQTQNSLNQLVLIEKPNHTELRSAREMKSKNQHQGFTILFASSDALRVLDSKKDSI